MLAWERWTLTHSSGGALVLALPLVLELGLVATNESSVVDGLAVVVDVAVVVGVAVGEGVAVVVDVADGEADDVEAVLEGDGEAVFLGVGLTLAVDGAVDDRVGGSLATAEWLADGLTEWLGEGRAEDEGDGDGEGDGDDDREGDGDDDREGDGDGDGVDVAVPDEGSAWHVVSVFGVAVGAACAVPSKPRIRKLPLSKVTAATLTGAKRIRIACLRCSSGLPSSLW